ncbi:MAG TPA: glycosyltransferase family 39 protein [Pirellulales bacterium]|jgi:4-amino-4-deoxy-L-arabinose transferase-like glycosyltransferase|nr:glycosyltransferase family 39 protein [Pirellulales bacterium]
MNSCETLPTLGTIPPIYTGRSWPAQQARWVYPATASKTKTAKTISTWRADVAPLSYLLLLGLLLRVALFAVAWHHSPDLASLYHGDTPGYLEPAKSLLSHGAFANQGVPELVRTPGYPLLLSLGVALGHVEAVTISLQMLLSLVTIVVIYRLTRSLTGSRPAAIAAGLFLAVEPMSLIYTSYLSTETLFTCLLVLMVAALVRYDRSHSFAMLTVAAALLATATLVRPISYFLPPVIALALLGRAYWRVESRLRCAVAALVFLVVAHGPAVAWQARNWAVAGYGGFSAISSVNLYFFQAASIVAHQQHQSLEAMQREMGIHDFVGLYEGDPKVRGDRQVENFRFMQREASRLIHQHPWVYANIHLRGLIKLMLDPGASDLLVLIDRFPSGLMRERPMDSGILAVVRHILRQTPAELCSKALLAIVPAVIYLAAAFGCLRCLGRWNWNLTLVMLVAGYLWIVAGGPTGIARLRHPVMPLACVASGIGIAEVLRWRAARRRDDHPRDNNQTTKQREAQRPGRIAAASRPAPSLIGIPAWTQQRPLEPTPQFV